MENLKLRSLCIAPMVNDKVGISLNLRNIRQTGPCYVFYFINKKYNGTQRDHLTTLLTLYHFCNPCYNELFQCFKRNSSNVSSRGTEMITKEKLKQCQPSCFISGGALHIKSVRIYMNGF